MPSGEHLKPYHFKPGYDPRRTGKPKGTPDGVRAQLLRGLQKKGLKAAIEDLRAQGVEIDKATVAEVVVMQLLRKAQMGDLEATKEIFKQTEKSLAQIVEHTGLDGGPIELEHASELRNRLVSKITSVAARIGAPEDN